MGALKLVKRMANGIASIALTLILAVGMRFNLIFALSGDVSGEWLIIVILAGWFWLRTFLTEKDKDRNAYHILLERVLLALPGVSYMTYIVSALMRYGMVPEWALLEPLHIMSYVFWVLMMLNFIVVPMVLLVITVVRMCKKRVRTGEGMESAQGMETHEQKC